MMNDYEYVDSNWCPDCGEPRGVCRCEENRAVMQRDFEREMYALIDEEDRRDNDPLWEAAQLMTDAELEHLGDDLTEAQYKMQYRRTVEATYKRLLEEQGDFDDYDDWDEEA